MKQKPQSGKSRYTKVVSFRLDNDKHASIARKAGGKNKVNAYLRKKAEREAK